MKRGRTATLVVVDGAGSVRGELGPVEVAEPWWPETGPIVDAVADTLPDAVVLRLLRAEPDPGQTMGGRVTHVVECRAALAPDLLREAADGAEWHQPHPLRLPWAVPGGTAADIDWVHSVVEVTGPGRQHKSWNLSSIWSFPVAAGPGSHTGRVWLADLVDRVAPDREALVGLVAGLPDRLAEAARGPTADDRSWRPPPRQLPTGNLAPGVVRLGPSVFQRFLDHIEPTERIHHRHDVALKFDEAEQLGLKG